MITPPRRPAKKTVQVKKRAAVKKAPAKKAAAKSTAGHRRDDQALKLRQGGAAFAAIGRKLRLRDAAAAHAAYERALARVLPEPPASTKRAELERIREVEEDLWPKAEGGDLAAIEQLVQLDLERQTLTRDNLTLADDRLGPIEAATLQEVKRLSEAAPALAATARILARTADETTEPGPRATVARELRMHMSQLRGLAGTNPKFNPVESPTPEAEKHKKGGNRVVVPETELEKLRRRAAERAAQEAQSR